jgi:hypothetical protein
MNAKLKLNGQRVAIVTGPSSAIGLGITQALRRWQMEPACWLARELGRDFRNQTGTLRNTNGITLNQI